MLTTTVLPCRVGLLLCISPHFTALILFTVPTLAPHQVLALSLALGTSFYYFHEHWELSTCYYYASQVLNGNMFDTPSQPEDDHLGLWFTLLLYVYGSTLMASAYGTYVHLTSLSHLHTLSIVLSFFLLFPVTHRLHFLISSIYTLQVPLPLSLWKTPSN